MLRRLTYRIWLLFGGRRTEDGFRFLSKDIIENRRQINELRWQLRKLKMSLRADASVEDCQKALDDWEDRAKELTPDPAP